MQVAANTAAALHGRPLIYGSDRIAEAAHMCMHVTTSAALVHASPTDYQVTKQGQLFTSRLSLVLVVSRASFCKKLIADMS